MPQLASYFDVTIDDLLDYRPQLSREQIRACYHKLAAAFAKQPFESVMSESEALVKKYYACYPFLLQICLLWLNHFMLAGSARRQGEILEQIVRLCDHILKHCDQIALCNDALVVRSMVKLQCGDGEAVIEAMAETLDPHRLSRQSDALLIQAYLLTGAKEKAEAYNQVSMFLHLVTLLEDICAYLNIHEQDLAVCERAIARADRMIDAFAAGKLHPNSVAGYQYQAALIYAAHGKGEQALQRLREFTALSRALFDDDAELHGDSFFHALDGWIAELDLGAQPVRDKKLILASVRQALDHPAFAAVMKAQHIAQMKEKLT